MDSIDKKYLKEIEDIIRINVDYISNKNGISFDDSQYLPKALSEQILKYIKEKVLEARIDVHNQYIKECPMGFELFAEEKIDELQQQLKEKE